MKLLVTGATGFLGRHVVAEALRCGHCARALIRPASVEPASQPNLEFVKADLRSPTGLLDAVRGCDAVIHLAAATSGDLYAQLSGTVVATENLLTAMTATDVRHIVAISSMAVYDYVNLPSRSTVTEDSLVDAQMPGRDDYAQTKMLQEMLIRQTAQSAGWRWTILRPGVIFGKGKLISARLGIQAGRWILRTGRSASIPLTYVENCAQAIIRAVESPQANGQILNIFDDAPPTQKQYAALLKSRLSPRPRILPIPWLALRFAAGAAQAVNESLLGGRAKIPGLLIPARLHARCKPLRYTNDRAKRILDWNPRYTLAQALDRSLQGEPT